MPNIIDILARALSLRQETALNSITPNRAGGIMYDTLLVLNQMQLEGGSLLISKVYASVSAMEADTTPTSDLTGRALKPGQLVVIVTSDSSSSDMGSEYRFNGPGSWTYVGKVGGLPLDTVPTQSSTKGITSGGVYAALAAMKAEGYKYMGLATPGSGGTAPGTPNQPVFYIAGPGSYPNFGSITVASGYLGFIKYSSGSWTVESVAVGKDYDEQISTLDGQISQLEAKESELNAGVNGGTFIKSLVWTDGYIRKNDGGIASSSMSKFTQPFILKKGQKVTVGTANSNICIIGTTNAQSLSVGDYVTVLQMTDNTGNFETHTYTADQDIAIVLCVKWSDYSLSFEETNPVIERLDIIEPKVDGLRQDVDTLKVDVTGVSKTEALSVGGASKYITIPGKFKTGDKVYISAVCDSSVSVNREFLLFQDSTNTGIQINKNEINKEVTLPYDSDSLSLYMYYAGILAGGNCTFTLFGKGAYDLNSVVNKVGNIEPEIETLNEINGTLSKQGATLAVGTSGYFIRNDGVIVANASYAISDEVSLPKGAKITFKAFGAVDVVSVLSRVVNDGYEPLVIATQSSSTDYEYQNDFESDINVVVNTVEFANNNGYTIYQGGQIGKIGDLNKLNTEANATLVKAINEVLSRIPEAVDYDGRDISTFAKIACIGDSLTEGAFNYLSGGSFSNNTKASLLGRPYSYPDYLKKLTGCDVVNFGKSGFTATQWYDYYTTGQGASTDFSGYDCAIIQLGVNDVSSTLDTVTKQALINIINKMKAANSGIKIFLSGIINSKSYPCAVDGESYYEKDQWLRSFYNELYANDNQVFFIDHVAYGHLRILPNVQHGRSYPVDNFNEGHLSAYGYWRLAQDYVSIISNIMHNDQDGLFRKIQFIGTEYDCY